MSDRVIKINKDTGAMTGYNEWPAGFILGGWPFSGGVFDGQNIWMIPFNADRVIKINTNTGTMTGYNAWPAGFSKSTYAFSGGVFDGQNIWMIPSNADRVIKINKDTGVMTGYNASGFSGNGGVFDGQNIWMVPSGDMVVKINKDTGIMTGYNDWPTGILKESSLFMGGVFDGQSIWLIPYHTDRVIKISTMATAGTPSSITVPSSDSDGNYPVSWGASSTTSVTYVLEEATNQDFTSGLLPVYSGTSTSASITGRSSGVTYYYRVKATRSGYTDSAWRTGSNGCVVTITPTAANPTYAWHTFYGSSNTDSTFFRIIDSSGNVYITGRSDASWGSPLHAHSGDTDIFVLKLDSSGTYQWNTFYGSNADDGGKGISVDSSGNIYISGMSAATWGSPLNDHSGGFDIFVLKLNGMSSSLYADFNNDGKTDILWRNTTDGRNTVWYMDGVTRTGSASLSTVKPDWKIVGL